jgi:hypothetical protein
MRVITLLLFTQPESDGLRAARRRSAESLKIVCKRSIRDPERVFVYKEYILIVRHELSSLSSALKVHERKIELSKIQERQARIAPLLLISLTLWSCFVKGRSFPRRS